MREVWIATLVIAACGGSAARDTDVSHGGETTGGDSDDSASTGLGSDASTSGATDMPPQTSTGSSSGDPMPANCGDGVKQLGESCDDGNDVDADGCNNDCLGSGEVLWTWTYSGGVGERDEGYTIAVGQPGEFYIAGQSANEAGAAADGWLRRLTIQGDELWAYKLTGAGTGNDVLRELAFDGEFLYVAGYTNTVDTAADLWLTKFDLDDVAAWTQTYDGPAGGSDIAIGVAVDAMGNVVTTGYHATVDEGADLVLRKYDPAGNVLWTRTYTGPAPGGEDMGRSVAATSDGTLYVAGNVVVTDEARNGFIARYDPDGNLIWSRLFNGAASASDYFNSITLSADEEPVICGYETLTDIPWRSIARRYDPQGTVVWTDSYDGAMHLGAYCQGFTRDHAGNYVMTGGEHADEGRVIMVRKLDASGSALWSRAFSYEGKTGYGLDVDVDGDDRIYVAGSVETTDDERDIFAGLLTP